MKTQEEIEQLAENYYISDYSTEEEQSSAESGFIQGYTQCQEDMADISVRFAEWIRIKDFQTASMNNWIGLDMKYYTTKELFEQFIQSLNKQD